MLVLTRDEAISKALEVYPNAVSLVAYVDTMPTKPYVYLNSFIVSVDVHLDDSGVPATTLQSKWNENEVDGDCLDTLFDLGIQYDRADQVAA